jgi:predicted transcriptional regulator of viral defense system
MADLLKWAEERPLFNLNEVERASGLDREQLRKKVFRLAKKGDLKRIERGLYTVHDDPLIYASNIERPSYISFWTALRYYDLTSQQPTKVQVVTGSRHEDLEDIEFHYSGNVFGYEKQDYQGFELNVAEKERLLIDILAYGEVPLEEIVSLVEGVDVDRAVEFAERFGKNAVKKRLGFLLDEVRNAEVEELKVNDRNYSLLDKLKSETGEKNSKWCLEVNNSAFESSA